jgi:hypothetical protein
MRIQAWLRVAAFVGAELGAAACGGDGDTGGGGETECDEDADCAGEAVNKLCNADRRVCVECVTTDNCGPVRPVCKDASACVECLVDTDCPGTGLTCTQANECQ